MCYLDIVFLAFYFYWDDGLKETGMWGDMHHSSGLGIDQGSERLYMGACSTN